MEFESGRVGSSRFGVSSSRSYLKGSDSSFVETESVGEEESKKKNKESDS